LREAPIGAAAREREADDGTRCEAVIEPGRAARRSRRKVVAADDCRIAAGPIAAAVTCAPDAPALLERRRLRRRLEQLGVGQRDVLRQVFALRRKAERGAGGARDAAPAIDEGIEHDPKELIRELK
jgi:hypothetical protein